MKLKPLGDRIVVKPSTEEEVTKSGIVLPDTVEKEKKEEGEVVAVGSGEKINKLNLKVGDVVIFSKYGGDEVTVEEIEYKVLKDEDVLAVLITGLFDHYYWSLHGGIVVFWASIGAALCLLYGGEKPTGDVDK